MVTVVTAPEKIEFPVGSIRIFLAGGIQKCREWQLGMQPLQLKVPAED